MGIPNYCADFQGHYDWVQVGSITATEAALAVSGRDATSVNALATTKKVLFSADDGTAAFAVRFRTDGNENDSSTLHLYAAKSSDYYTKMCDITALQGLQDWSSGHFVDSLVLSSESWQPGIRVDSPTDEIGRLIINTGGYEKFLFIASAKTPTTIYIDICRVDKIIKGDVYSAIVEMAGDVDMSDVVSAVHDEGDNQITEVSDAVSNLKSALSGYISDVVEAEGATKTEVSDAVSNLKTAVGDADATSAVLAMDSAQSGMFSTLEKDVVSVHSQAVLAVGHLDSAVDAIDEVKAEVSDAVSNLQSTVRVGLDRTSTTGGTQKITLSSGTGQGGSQACRACLVKPAAANTADVHVQIGSTADADDLPLDAFVTPIPVDNLTDLYFYSTDADAIVYILWRD